MLLQPMPQVRRIKKTTPNQRIKTHPMVRFSQPVLNGGGMTQETSDPVGEILNQDLSVVLISNALDQIERWSDAVLDEAQVIVYDYDTDDLASVVGQLTILAETQGREIGHLAILSHGGPGAIYFSANELVTLETIAVDPSDWRQLDGILAEDARIDFYGCDVGRGEAGLELVAELSELSGAIVWASDDATGSSEYCDWELEVRTGDSFPSLSY